jgi:nitrate reductase assembly molybdenum cofactor insertion protein NarJ
MISESRVKNLRWRFGLKGCLAVDSKGKHGGLALFWYENIQVDLLAIDERYIDVFVRENSSSDPWRATFIYGEPRVEDRHRMWEILQRLKSRSNDP